MEAGGARGATGSTGVMQLAVGLHTASGPAVTAKPIDIGVGYVATVYEGQPQRGRSHGIYLELDRFLWQGAVARVSAGGRTVMLIDGNGMGIGAHGRLDAELYRRMNGPGESETRCGSSTYWASGTGGFGLYTEVGGERLPGGPSAFLWTAGFTLRTPALVGLLFFVPGCKE